MSERHRSLTGMYDLSEVDLKDSRIVQRCDFRVLPHLPMARQVSTASNKGTLGLLPVSKKGRQKLVVRFCRVHVRFFCRLLRSSTENTSACFFCLFQKRTLDPLQEQERVVACCLLAVACSRLQSVEPGSCLGALGLRFCSRQKQKLSVGLPPG